MVSPENDYNREHKHSCFWGNQKLRVLILTPFMGAAFGLTWLKEYLFLHLLATRLTIIYTIPISVTVCVLKTPLFKFINVTFLTVGFVSFSSRVTGRRKGSTIRESGDRLVREDSQRACVKNQPGYDIASVSVLFRIYAIRRCWAN